VRDVKNGTTTLASVTSTGGQFRGTSAPAISDDGRTVAWLDTGDTIDETGPRINSHQSFVRNLAAGQTTTVSVSDSGEQGNRGGGNLSLSGDGSLVAFDSASTNLVPNDTNASDDVFVHQVSPAAPATCPNGTSEQGIVSAPVHSTVEPLVPPVQPVVHQVNCDVIVPTGL
jgi:hypothetical protein